MLENEFCYDCNYELCSFCNLSVTSPTLQLILQPFCHFTYVTAHYPTFPSLYLRHSSFSNPSVALPTSQLILQPFPLLHLHHKFFTLVTWRATHSTKHPAPLVLNGPSQFQQCFTVTLSIHHLTSGQKIDEENVPPVLEHHAHHFPHWQSLLEFHLAGRSNVIPMHWLLLGFWGNKCNPCFTTCDDLVQKLVTIIMVPLRITLCAGVSGFGTHQMHNFLNNMCSVTILCNKQRKICRKWLLSFVTVKRWFFLMRSCTSSTRSSTMIDFLQPFCHFTYVTTHSPTLLLLHHVTAHSPTLLLLLLHHSSFSNRSFASPTSQALHLIHLASRPWKYSDNN